MSYVKVNLVDRFAGIPIQEDTTVMDVIETILEKNEIPLGGHRSLLRRGKRKKRVFIGNF